VIFLKAVILAAGEGRRCRPLTQTRSKVMLPVANRPFMEHVIRALAACEVKDLLVVVGYQKERIMNHFEDGLRYGVNITYVAQDELLGTAHALSKVRDHIEGDFLVLNGDNLLDERAIKDLMSAPGEEVILSKLREHSGDYGVLTVEGGKVTRIVEKPGRPCAGILNTGAYRFSPQIFEELSKTPISERGSYELTQTISQMINSGKDIRAMITEGVWSDAIYAWDLLTANSLAATLQKPRVQGEVEEGAVLKGPVVLGRNSLVRTGSYIVGPVIIGKNCDIGPNVMVLPVTSIGDSVRVGFGSELRNSIVMSGTKIGSGCIISDSVIGASSSFADQVLLESGSASVEVEEGCHHVEFGAVVADNVTAGSRAFMNPGTIIGTDCKIGSCTTLHGNVERGTRVI